MTFKGLGELFLVDLTLQTGDYSIVIVRDVAGGSQYKILKLILHQIVILDIRYNIDR